MKHFDKFFIHILYLIRKKGEGSRYSCVLGARNKTLALAQKNKENTKDKEARVYLQCQNSS